MGKSSNVKTETDGEVLDGKRVHELAKLLPPMSHAEFESLVENVKANGLEEPIVLLDGQILDGVHRLKACLKAKKKLEYTNWNGECGSPFQFVCTKNLSRRNLSYGQKAVIAVTLEKEFAKTAKLRMSSRNRTKQGVETFPHHDVDGKARDAAAKAVGVNPHYVTDAKSLAKSRPDLLKEVWRGPSRLRQPCNRSKAINAMKEMRRIRSRLSSRAGNSHAKTRPKPMRRISPPDSWTRTSPFA